MSNTFTGSYADGQALTKLQLDTAYQTLQLDIANTALTTTGSTTGQAMISNGSGAAASFQTIPDPQGPFALRNYGLKASASSHTLTIGLTTKAGTDPTSIDAVNFNYSTNGTAAATYNTVNVAAAVSVTIPASATLGFASGTSTQPVFVYGYYNTVTTSVKLAVSSSSYFDTGLKTTMTALSASSDNANTLYATAVLSVSPRLLGIVKSAFSSFAGDWTAPQGITISNNSTLNNKITAQYIRYVAIGQSSATTVTKAGTAISSASCGIYSITSSTATTVTNLSITITTSGRPVQLSLIPTAEASLPATGPSVLIPSVSVVYLTYYRDSTPISSQYFSGNGVGVSTTHQPISYLDIVAAGTYTYSLKASRVNSNAALAYFKLAAYEI